MPLLMLCAVSCTLVSCIEPATPMIEFYLFDEQVSCPEGTRVCQTANGPAQPEKYQLAMKLSRSRSSLAPDGLLVHIKFQRRGDLRARLSLDLPINRTGGIAGRPLIEYTEHRGRDLLFKAAQAAGRIELGLSKGCPCQTGRLELILVDPGQDGILGTEDDMTRRISQARLSFDDRPFCHQRAALEVKEDLLVMGFRDCPARRGAVARGGGGSFAWDEWGMAASTWNEEQWYDESWAGEDPEDWESYEPWDGDDCGQCDSWTDDDDWGDDDWGDDDWGDDDWGDDDWDDDDWGDDDWGDDDWGDDDWGDDDWGDDDWGDDDWGDDDWGDDDWGDDDWGD